MTDTVWRRSAVRGNGSRSDGRAVPKMPSPIERAGAPLVGWLPVAGGPLSAQSRNMTQPENNKPPSKKLIGGRVRVKSDRATDAARLFDAGVLAPIYVEHRDDGDVSFWFGNAPRQG